VLPHPRSRIGTGRLTRTICRRAAICVNFKHDVSWLLSEAPALRRVPVALLYQSLAPPADPAPPGGAGLPVNVHPHQPALPIPFGTHHAKLLVLGYGAGGGGGVRVCVQTANNLLKDNELLTDAVWAQDFPPKAPGPDPAPAPACQFEEDLVDFLRRTGWSGMPVPMSPGPGLGRVGPQTLRTYDFSGARAVLLPSVPGRHSGPDLHR
jgi:hypothetical protein